MSARTPLEPGYVLHYSRYGETSLIIEAFTLVHGRVALFARGATGKRSRYRSLVQPFQPLLLSWTGESGLRTLTGIEERHGVHEFSNRQLACAYYLNELIMRLLGQDQPDQQVFSHYTLALAELADCDDVEVPLRRFELMTLQALGLLPDILHCADDGSTIEPGLYYRFHPLQGLKREHDTLPDAELVNEPADDSHSVRVSGASLQSLARYDFSEPGMRSDVKRMMRRLIEEHIGGKPLKSREVFDQLLRSPS